MTKAQLLEIANRLADGEEVVGFIYEKSDAIEFMNNNELEMSPPLTDEEWSTIIGKMAADENAWQTVDDALKYYLEELTTDEGEK